MTALIVLDLALSMVRLARLASLARDALRATEVSLGPGFMWSARRRSSLGMWRDGPDLGGFAGRSGEADVAWLPEPAVGAAAAPPERCVSWITWPVSRRWLM